MLIDIYNSQNAVDIDRERIGYLVRAVLNDEGVRFDEVAIYFVNKEAISELHNRFFDDPSPTDCISLPLDDVDEGGYRHLGEVFVCPEIGCEYAERHSTDPLEETALYVIHGLLHLIGYDDLEEEACKLMRSKERYHLTRHWQRPLR